MIRFGKHGIVDHFKKHPKVTVVVPGCINQQNEEQLDEPSKMKSWDIQQFNVVTDLYKISRLLQTYAQFIPKAFWGRQNLLPYQLRKRICDICLANFLPAIEHATY